MNCGKPVKQLKVSPNESIKNLIDGFGGTAFGARRLSDAARIYSKMLENKSQVFMTLAGAMVPAGMRSVITEFVRSGYVSVLVTTGANLTHDLIEALGLHHYQGTQSGSDSELRKKHVNRIYDVFMPNDVYEKLEDFINTLEIKPDWGVTDLLDYLGSKITDENSILRACHDKGVPVFCPAFTDCGLGMMLALNNPSLKLDVFKDLRAFIGLAWQEARPNGVFIVGGGVPKNYVFQAMQFNAIPASYAIQITTDRPESGGLSGAELREAISWGKISEKADYVTVPADATIVLPLILAYLKSSA